MTSTPEPPTGVLYLVSLPIGNRADITLRAIQVLRSADFIIAEDTRTTRPLLDFYRISTPLRSSLYREVEGRREADLVAQIRRGEDAALVSDAGTPLISDPGFALVREAIASGIPVVPIPGPSALLAAATGSGFPIRRFCFEGMLRGSSAERREFVERIRYEPRTVVVYESCHRVLPTLEALAQAYPERHIAVARELTKLHEEFLRGTAAEIHAALLEQGRPRGEFVLLIEGSDASSAAPDVEAAAQLVELLRTEGVSNPTLVRALMLALGMPRNRAYAFVHSENAGS